MKHLFAALFSICLLESSLSAEIHYQKRYVDSKEIQISENKVFLKTENGIFRIKSLHSDKKGLYILEQTKMNEIEKGIVICSKCGLPVDDNEKYMHMLLCNGRSGNKHRGRRK